MTLLDLLNEYIELGYPYCPDIPYRDVDIELGDLIIARWSISYCNVIYLINGSSLIIPKELIKLCSGFYDSRGDEIVRLKETPGSVLWEMIVISKRILDKKPIDPKNLKSTEEIRSWLRNKHNILIDPIQYITTHYKIITI